MVRRALCASVCLALLAQPAVSTLAWAETAAAITPTAASVGAGSPRPVTPTGTAYILSPTADVLVALPGRPPAIVRTPNNPVEDFFAVTLISMPFMALWALVGALAVGGVAQHRFPPDFDTPLLAGAGAFAAGGSVVCGLVSVKWGGRKPSPTPLPTPIPTAQP